MQNKKINILNIFILIISIFIVCFFAHLSRNCVFWGDDSCYAVYIHPYEKYFDCLIGDTRTEHGGYYIGLFLCKFLSFGLPNLIGIHPADFVGIGHGFIRGIFTAICLYITARFSIITNKSKLIHVFVFLFLACYFFLNGMNSNVIIINYNFYRYFFSLIFFGYFLYFLYQNMIFCKKRNKSSLKLFTMVLFGFVIGTSIEITFFTSILFITLIIFYNLFLNRLSLFMRNKNIKQNKYNLDDNFYLPCLGLILGVLLFTTTEGFKSVAEDRGLNNIALTLTDLKEFASLYWNVCFQNEYIYWILFIVTAGIALYFSIKNKEIKQIIFPLLLQLSILAVIFSLVLCGKTYDETTRDRFYLHHWNIVFLYKMLILYPLLICFDYAYQAITKKLNSKHKIIFSCIIIFTIIFGCLLYTDKIIKFYPDANSNNFMYNQKKIYYILEKVYRFYTLREEMPVLPDYYDTTQHATYPYYRDININENPINNFYLKEYYLRLYKKPTSNYQFIMKDNALEEFYAKGGVLTEEELKKLSFTKLLDDDFVLNKK